jgi:TPR repeat protein
MRLAMQDEQIADGFDEDAVDQGFVDYGSDPSLMPRGRTDRDFTMPQFLGGDGAAAGPQAMGLIPRWDWLWAWRNQLTRPWVLRGVAIAAVAAAIALGGVYLDRQFDLFATAKAALFGAPTDDADAAATPDSTAPAQPAENSPYSQSTVGMRSSPLTARASPTRDDIAAALRQARPDPMDSGQPFTGSPTRTLGADEVASLSKRGKGLLAMGDIVAARLLLQRAADAQDATAALLMAETYDPAVLGSPDARIITSDRAAARNWYERAAGLGSVNAKQRLAQMQN